MNVSKKQTNKEKEYSFNCKEFSEQELIYWEKFGVTLSMLNQYDIKSIQNYTYLSKVNKSITVNSSEHYPIFGYAYPSGVKIFKPFDFRCRHHSIGSINVNTIFGWDQLPESGKTLFIVESHLDVLCLASHSLYAISTNSVDLVKFEELKRRFKTIIFLHNDNISEPEHFTLKSPIQDVFHIGIKQLIGYLFISYFIASGNSISEFKSRLRKEISEAKNESTSSENKILSSLQLIESGETIQKYLLQDILPQIGTAVFAGKPDIGKSQWVRQLCIQLVLGIWDFCGFKLNPVWFRALYIATEDNSEATRYLLNKQFKGLSAEPSENLRFMFADSMDQAEILEKLDTELKEYPSDLVVIDSFGDIFTGADSNNNMAMRNTVKLFDKIANKHKCLIMFVHHINKGAYRQSPAQENIQGGSGLVQKVRLAIQLSEGDGNLRYFTVVKGNYCPKEYKQNSIELLFSEETFLFKHTGKMIPTNEIGSHQVNAKNEEQNEELINIAYDIFQNDVVSYSDFCNKFQQSTGKSIPTAKRAHNTLKKLDIIVKGNGGYRFKESDNADNIVTIV